LLAYGEGLLENLKPEQAAGVLAELLVKLPDSLMLDSPKKQWLSVLRQLLADKL
jgi:F-type H+-transporting ATPase subunit alpha